MRADKISFGQHIAKVQYNDVKDLTGTKERISGAKGSSMVLDGDTIQKDGTFCILDGEGKLKIAKFKGAYQESAAGKTVTKIMYQDHKPVSVLSCLPNATKSKVVHDVQQVNSVEHPLLQLFSPEGVHKLLRRVEDVAHAVKEEVRLTHLFSKH